MPDEGYASEPDSDQDEMSSADEEKVRNLFFDHSEHLASEAKNQLGSRFDIPAQDIKKFLKLRVKGNPLYRQGNINEAFLKYLHDINYEPGGIDPSELIGEAEKLVECDNALTQAVRASGDKWHKNFKNTLQSIYNKDESTKGQNAVETKRKMEAEMLWYRSFMYLAREKAREVSRIDITMMEDDANHMQKVKLEVLHMKEKLEIQKKRMKEMHEYEKEAMVKHQENDEARARRRVDAEFSAEDYIAEAHIVSASLTALQGYSEARSAAWQIVLELLKCTAEDLVLDTSNANKLRCARFSFLLVILGCELDMWGYLLAFVTYWKPDGTDLCFVKCEQMTLTLMHCLLLLGPISYIAAILFKFYLESEEEYYGDVEQGAGNNTGLQEPLITDTKRKKSKKPKAEGPNDALLEFGQLKDFLQKMATTIHYYHIVPIIRNYLLIKEMEPNDVEALFRVNGLSTFTLGFAQISCMVLGVSKGWLPWPPTVVLMIGIFAQIVNFSMTAMSYGTSVPVMMETSNTIDALISCERRKLQSDLCKYNNAAQDVALKGWASNPELLHGRPPVLQLFHDKMEREIKEAVCLKDLNLSIFTMEEKIKIVFYMRAKKINQFVHICKLGTPDQSTVTDDKSMPKWCNWCKCWGK